MRIAAVNWELEPGNGNTFLIHLERIIREGVAGGADVIVLPECIDLETLGFAPADDMLSLAAQLADTAPRRIEAMGELSASHGITLVGGSMLVREGDQIRNRCHIFESGELTTQDKLVMTQFELTEWGVAAGVGLATPRDQRLGVTVCYDSEFPISGRLLAERGCLVQCVPSYTETQHGFQRVRWSCRARAIENQNFVIHTSLVGNLGGEPVPSTFGSSAILTPSCSPFPDDAILAETAYGVEGIAFADLDFDQLDEARRTGDVRNWDDRNRGEWE